MQSDPTPIIVLVVIAVIAVAVVSAAVGRARDRRYVEGVASWAASLGWRYREGGGGTWTSRLPRGVRSGVRLLVEGSRDGFPVTVAHYWWETREQRTRQENGHTRWETVTVHHAATVHVVHLPAQQPTVAVNPRGLGSKMARGLGLSGVVEVGVEEFDRRFRVDTQDPAGRALITAALIQAHIAGAVPVWSVDGRDLIGVQNHALKTDTVLPFLDSLLRVAKLLAAT
ncbi:hypothetical protein CS0771_45790 [Catellatospora sp. IY07-71]|uniref:hypothetical protein n=1 Tax=Catellatospora sp. IY07-71 TaxID=2728827 RepID=UPI001BB43D2A|nr:hypothetical protein [Catellatospora sp. IY07-71]BCJ75035.1 hypothetical protein CS0771_45790 [Catellatospora sp. IY07-71]